jgi:Flp pilus assembly pilin Flp
MLKLEFALLVGAAALLLASLTTCIRDALWGRWSR